MKKQKKRVAASAVMLALFAIWTAVVCTVDVRAIGPLGSEVGLGGLNGRVRETVGTNFFLYFFTDVLSVIPLGCCGGFGIMGLVQLVKRRSLKKVDRKLIVLGLYLASVAAAYLVFELAAVNMRPVLVEGVPEVSYPSSTTLLVLSVMPAAVMTLDVQKPAVRKLLNAAAAVFCVFMVGARVISGVHWISDIIGGMLLSGALVFGFAAAMSRVEKE